MSHRRPELGIDIVNLGFGLRKFGLMVETGETRNQI